MRHRHSEGATAIGSPSPHPQPSFEALEQTLDLGPQIVDADPDRANLWQHGGASTIAGGDGSRQPGENELTAGRHQGQTCRASGYEAAWLICLNFPQFDD
jgi:hypothetical protein